MTDAEYNAAKGVMYQKYKNGEISKYAYDKWKRENNPAKSGTSGGAAAGDYGVKATDAAVERLQGKLEKVYGQAQEEIMEKLDQFTGKYAAKEARMLERLATGQIDQDELNYWRMGQIFQTQQWKNKVEQVTGTLLSANEQAMAIIDKDKMGVFVENANFQSYQLEKEAGMNLSFAIYDADTVARLIEEQPELLPRKVVEGVKDKAWNQKQIANSISQGIIQGETIPQIAKRIARDTSSANGKNMVRYARTAMTGAQNAGRIETLKRAQSMGIKVKKVWLATLDGRTRDSHREMDGQVAEPDGYFRTPLGSKMKYPGDLNGKGGDVWNCRCTLIYKYDDYPSNPDNDLRRDNETGELIQNMTYRQWQDWKKAGKPQSEKKTEPSALKKKLDALTNPAKQKTGIEALSDDIKEQLEAYAGGDELRLSKEQMNAIKQAMTIQEGAMYRVEDMDRIGSVNNIKIGQDFNFAQQVFESKDSDLGALRSFTKEKDDLADLCGQVADPVIYKTVGGAYQLDIAELSMYDQHESLCFGNRWKVVAKKKMIVDGQPVTVIELEQKKDKYPKTEVS